jgi:hypothetical protein
MKARRNPGRNRSGNGRSSSLLINAPRDEVRPDQARMPAR